MRTTNTLERAETVSWRRKRYLVVGILALGVIAGQAVWTPGNISGDRGPVRARVLLSEDQLIGDRVVDIQGESLGVVNDVIVDRSDGRLVYALISPEGYTGSSDEVIPVPWKMIDPSENQHEFVLTVTKQDLKNAVRFFKDKGPDLDDPCWDGDFQMLNGVPHQNGPNDRNMHQLPDWPPTARQ